MSKATRNYKEKCILYNIENEDRYVPRRSFSSKSYKIVHKKVLKEDKHEN